MKPFLVLVVIFAFVESLPQRFVPRGPAPRYAAMRAYVRPMDRWYYALPPVERATGSIVVPRRARREEVAPAYGIAAVSYAVAFFTIGSDGVVVPRVFRFFHDLGGFLLPGLLGAATTAAVVCLFLYITSPNVMEEDEPEMEGSKRSRAATLKAPVPAARSDGSQT